MIGVSGSRHIGRRRGSTASTQQQHRLSIIESDIGENSDRRNSQHRDSKDVSDGSAAVINRKQSTTNESNQPTTTTTTATTTTTKSPNQQQQQRRQSSRMSISTGGGGESFPATRFRQRRRAVEISDQRTCALLHSRLKGMKLEDIA
uniref:Uncharacterized protein LOC113795235 n=1 Tax=Dermatophagoides pteronyssinus TaxID=6956 RepID=A0A6P6Y730_DERPT|nr:uncharacterized protein LOC113795235 [Dermatophagoides pteronyssinus]